ncbi:MAG: DUF2071 domain-containing protein, partial [Phycisphaerales bacterium JB060]
SHELKGRTLETPGVRRGVWFSSRAAPGRRPVEVARSTFRLAYFNARMSLEEHDGRIEYASERSDRRGEPATLRCTYNATGTPQQSQPGSLEAFLTDRYRLFASDLPPREPKRLWVGEIDHDPWMLAPAWCEVEHNSMARPLGIQTPADTAVLHLAEPVTVRAWRPSRVL